MSAKIARLRKMLRRVAKDTAPSMAEITEAAKRDQEKKKGVKPASTPTPPPRPSPQPRNLEEVKSVDLFKSKMEETRLLNSIKGDDKFPLKPAEYLIWRMIPNDRLFGGLVPIPRATDGMTWREAHSPTGVYRPEVKTIRMVKFKNFWDRMPDSRKWLAIKKVVVNNTKTFPTSKEILTNYAKTELSDAHNTQGALIYMGKDPEKYGKLKATVGVITNPKYLVEKVLPQIKTNKQIPGVINQLLKVEFPEVAAQFAELEQTQPDYANAIVNTLTNELRFLLRDKNEKELGQEQAPAPSSNSETDRVLNQTSPALTTPSLPLAAKPFSDFEAEFSSIVTKKKAKLKDVDLIVKNMLDIKDEYKALNPNTAETLRDKLTKYLKKFYVTNHAWSVMSANNPSGQVDMTQRVDVSNTQGQQQVLSTVTPPMTNNQKAITGEAVIKTLGNTAAIRGAIRSAIDQQDQNNQTAIAQALDPNTSFCSAFSNIATNPHPDLARVAVNVDPSILSNLAGLPQPAQVNNQTISLPQNATPDPNAIPIMAPQLPQMVGNPMSLLSMNPQNMQGMIQMMALNQAMGSVNRQQSYQTNMTGLSQQLEAFKQMMESLKATVEPIWGDEMTRRFEHEAYNTFMSKFMELFMMQTLSNQFGVPSPTMNLFTQQQMQQMNQQPQGGQAFVEIPQGMGKVAKNLKPMQNFGVALLKEMTQPTNSSIVGLAQIIVTTAK